MLCTHEENLWGTRPSAKRGSNEEESRAGEQCDEEGDDEREPGARRRVGHCARQRARDAPPLELGEVLAV